MTVGSLADSSDDVATSAPSADRSEAAAGQDELKERQEVASAELVPGIDHDLEHHLAETLVGGERPLATLGLSVSDRVTVAATGPYRAMVDMTSLLPVLEDMTNVAHTAQDSCSRVVAGIRRNERTWESGRCLEDEAD